MENCRPNAAIHQTSAYVLYCFVRPGGYGQFGENLQAEKCFFAKHENPWNPMIFRGNYNFHKLPNIPRNVWNINIPLGKLLVRPFPFASNAGNHQNHECYQNLVWFMKHHLIFVNPHFRWNLHCCVESHCQDRWYSTRDIDVWEVGGRKCYSGARKGEI